MTSYTVISDTHGLEDVDELLKNCHSDVLIHCGDFTTGAGRVLRDKISTDHYQSMVRFSRQLLKVRHQFKHVICVPGNHDKLAEVDGLMAKDILGRKTNAHLLIDESITLDGVKYYGMPWTPSFNNWFFNARPEVEKIVCDKIEYDTQVLITHGPPYGLLDQVDGKPEHLGSRYLKEKLPKLHKLNLHVFGHIHSPGGTVKLDNYKPGGSRYVAGNCAVLGEDYVRHCPPIRLAIDH